jgi:DNA repair exonuclease SbcCD ATPase subunit
MITFKNVKFKNFGSFGNYFTEIDFCSDNMTLVSGSNGHGKSYAFLDSITFALFGKPFRKINIPQLINTVNNADCVVHLKFEIYGNEYEIVRGLKPKKFEIHKNGELLEQSAKSKDYQKLLEEQILKMNYKSFTQIVTLGSSSFVPFMQLSTVDRREVIEDILDINIFSCMNQIIKAKLSMVKHTVRELENTIEVLNEKIQLQEQTIKSFSDKKKETESNLTNKIDDIKNEIQQSSNELQILTTSLLPYIDVEDKQSKVQSKMSKFESSIVGLIQDKTKTISSVSFYEDHSTCPTCSQEITDTVKTNELTTLNESITEIEYNIVIFKKDYNELKSSLEELNQEFLISKNIEAAVREKNNEINAANKYMTSLMKSTKEESGFDESILECKNKKNNYIKEKTISLDRIRTQKNLKSNLDVLFMLLKDSGIKAKIIKNYLPVINDIINKYLNRMNFFVSFTLDEEFNEEIKSRHRDTFSYMNFSEGEKSRIDLAILLAWRKIAKIKNSAHCNLLILDEIFDSSLDSVGVDDLMKVLQDLSQESNIFVITHKSDQLADKFSNSMTFCKNNNFSRLK